MLIGPIVFLTIIGGIASVANLSAVGKTGIKALVYFQGGTILALATGLVAINLIPLGNSVHANVDQIETTDAVNSLIEKGENQHWYDFITHIVPSSVVEPFVEGDILQIIFLAVIFGVALNAVGRIGAPILDLVQRATKVIFKVLSYIMGRIIQAAERATAKTPPIGHIPHTQQGVIALAAKDIAERLDAKALVAFTNSGETVRRLARLHSELPLLAFTPHESIRSQLALSWGVHTLVTPAVDTIDELFDQVDQAVLALPGYEVNDMVVVLAGSSSRSTARTSLIRVHRLGHPD